MKKVIFIVIPLALIGGVFGVAKMGIIQIPGISPKKKDAAGMYAADKDGKSLYAADKQEPVVKNEVIPPTKPVAKKVEEKPKEPEFTLDEAQGRKKLAKLWNEMTVDDLLKIVADWKDEDLAPQLSVMDPTKVAPLLAKLDPKRASNLSKLIQDEASKIYEPQ